MGLKDILSVSFDAKAKGELEVVKSILGLSKSLNLEFVNGNIETTQKKVQKEEDVINYVKKYPKLKSKSNWRLWVDCKMGGLPVVIHIAQSISEQNKWNIDFNCVGDSWLIAHKEQKKQINEIILKLSKKFNLKEIDTEYKEMKGKFNQKGVVIWP